MIDDGPSSHPPAKKRKIDEESKNAFTCAKTQKSQLRCPNRNNCQVHQELIKPHVSLKKRHSCAYY